MDGSMLSCDSQPHRKLSNANHSWLKRNQQPKRNNQKPFIGSPNSCENPFQSSHLSEDGTYDEHFYDVQRNDLFGFIRITMQIGGMYSCRDVISRVLPNYLNWLATFLDLSFELFSNLVVLHIAIMYICTLYFFWDEGDLEFLVNCFIQTIIYIWALGMKLFFRRIKKKTVWELLENFNQKHRIRSAEGFTFVTMIESLQYSRIHSKVFIYSAYVGTAFWGVLPLVYGDRSLPLACWYPFDHKQPFIYEALFFLQLFGQIQIAAAFTAASGFYMTMTILICGQYDVLFCSLKNILATTYCKMCVSKNKLNDLKKNQSIADEELNQYYCSKEIKVPIDFLFRKSQHLSDKTAPKTFMEAFEVSFKDCVQHHWFIIEALQKTEDIFSRIWYLKIGERTILLCLVIFVAVKSTSANSFMKMVSLGQYVLLVIWEVLIICYFGEAVYLTSQRSGEAILRSPWYLHIREMKSNLLFFLLNSKTQFRLTAAKIYPLNTQRFRSVMTTTFSFLTLLQKMDARN